MEQEIAFNIFMDECWKKDGYRNVNEGLNTPNVFLNKVETSLNYLEQIWTVSKDIHYTQQFSNGVMVMMTRLLAAAKDLISLKGDTFSSHLEKTQSNISKIAVSIDQFKKEAPKEFLSGMPVPLLNFLNRNLAKDPNLYYDYDNPMVFDERPLDQRIFLILSAHPNPQAKNRSIGQKTFVDQYTHENFPSYILFFDVVSDKLIRSDQKKSPSRGCRGNNSNVFS